MFIELYHPHGFYYLFDPNSHWEIFPDKDSEYNAALWVNSKVGRNLECADSYTSVKKILAKAGLFKMEVER